MTSLPVDFLIADAAERVGAAVRKTPLEVLSHPALDERIALRLKLECKQETGSFKARGAWNQVSQLTPEERAKGVVATSSGNHGQALAWAAQRAGVPATIFMAANSYPNKIEACRNYGAEVVLPETRLEAEQLCEERIAAGAVLIHPYDAERTVQGAGTVGLEIAQEWPAVDVCIFPVGGGGLISGSSLALRQSLSNPDLKIFGAEPEGAPTMSRALEAGEPVDILEISTDVQGLCPIAVGHLNTRICQATVDRVFELTDPEIYAAQRLLAQATGYTIEPAGAAAFAAVLSEQFFAELGDALDGHSATNPLGVAVVISGGNPHPTQFAELLER